MKTFLISLFLMFTLNVFGQDRKMPIFLLMDEESVESYLDSLNKLSSNPYYKVKKLTAGNGDLVLKCDYAINEEYLYKCLSVYTRFTRIQGINICSSQMITGSEDYSEDNLIFVKDNFTSLGNGKWEMEYIGTNGKADFLFLCEFKREDGKFPSFEISYEITKNKKQEVAKSNHKWLKIIELDNSYLYSKIEQKYINDKGQTIFRVWTKDFKYNSQIEGQNVDLIGRTLVEINCSTKKANIIELNTYDIDDNLIANQKYQKSEWFNPIFGSPMYYYVEYTCKLFNETKAPK